MFKEILLEKLEANPFQVRQAQDSEVIGNIAETSKDKLGIRSPPLVRSHPTKDGFYQIAFGHGRIDAARLVGLVTIWCRVEDLTDGDMKTEVLIENVNRSDLNEKELYAGLKQVAEDRGIDLFSYGSQAELIRITGINRGSVQRLVDANKLREKLHSRATSEVLEKASAHQISTTSGLEDEDRVKVLKKAQESNWRNEDVRKVSQAIRKASEPIRKKILEAAPLAFTPKVIEEVMNLETPREQERVLDQIQTYHLREDDALKTVERVKDNREPEITIYKDETQEVMDEFRNTLLKVKTWGVNQYGILGEIKWSEATEFFTEIENHMRWLKRQGWLENLERIRDE